MKYACLIDIDWFYGHVNLYKVILGLVLGILFYFSFIFVYFAANAENILHTVI